MDEDKEPLMIIEKNILLNKINPQHETTNSKDDKIHFLSKTGNGYHDGSNDDDGHVKESRRLIIKVFDKPKENGKRLGGM